MQDFSNSSPASLSAEDFDQSFREVDLGARVDGPIRTTFHVYKSDERIGFFLEKVFDEQGRLIRMTKRTADGRSETRFDP
ncbi:MAG TPA: hypothetical protein PL112_19185, partial [Candidatus Obscuribacter sp.]|nr:hypothetical protein [Candidatus Obscuribacter sp.]